MVKKSAKGTYPKAKPGSTLWAIGFWATGWWAISCLYVLLVVLQATNKYSKTGTGSFWDSIEYVYYYSNILWVLLLAILMGWIVGGLVWMQELKKQKISRRTALKELFFTLRK